MLSAANGHFEIISDILLKMIIFVIKYIKHEFTEFHITVHRRVKLQISLESVLR